MGWTVTFPTTIPSFDDVPERILPSAIYIAKKKFPLASPHWRLELACAYLLFQYDSDPNTFVLDIPNVFEPKNFAQESFEKMSRNIADSDKAHNDRKNVLLIMMIMRTKTMMKHQMRRRKTFTKKMMTAMMFKFSGVPLNRANLKCIFQTILNSLNQRVVQAPQQINPVWTDPFVF